MAIPQFPSEDLAKLVLGYLADEELMIAYDEFLQASPYLDALRNEFGRIFMKSLKDIVAEYMAVKIYLESCKPISLRRKLLQCTNLLEIVKFLIAFVDVQKINLLDGNERRSFCKQDVLSKRIKCNACHAINSSSCLCKSLDTSAAVNSENSTHEAVKLGSTLFEHSGNTSVKNCSHSESKELKSNKSNNINQLEDQVFNRVEDSHGNIEASSTPEHNIVETSISQTVESSSKPEVTNEVNETFDHKTTTVNTEDAFYYNASNHTVADTSEKVEASAAGCADAALGTPNVDHSPPILVQEKKTLPMIGLSQQIIKNIKGPPKSKQKVTAYTKLDHGIAPSNTDNPSNDQKIKILSDVKVDNIHTNNIKLKIPQMFKASNATTSSNMQTIFINGTPAYKSTLQTDSKYNYSKDEIMAMPTIILVPTSGTADVKKLSLPQDCAATAANLDVNLCKSTTAQVLRPLGLIIDVSSDSVPVVEGQESEKPVSKCSEKSNDVGLLTTIDLTTGSLPKQNKTTSVNKISTPSVLPPARKSSSTPRRTSHVRVLDFTTPRRILGEAGCDKNINSSDSCKTLLDELEEVNEKTNDENDNNRSNHAKIQINRSIHSEKKAKSKRNWDADLRALALSHNSDDGTSKKTLKKICSQSKTNKEKPLVRNEDSISIKSSGKINNGKNKKSPKSKKVRTQNSSVETAVETDIQQQNTLSSLIKEDISINVECEAIDSSKLENVQSTSKIESTVDVAGTPEAERLALQNVIGGKLNISELLETPYKQVLYDIQMETPRFLGPDLPGDEPMSDIKIMNIPTPRFFDTPKVVKATPSSYSSRPTDYSSGGSYYKPDDEDYIPIDEVLECAITIDKVTTTKSESKKNIVHDLNEKPKRPVRKCTKNVSYRNSNVKEDLKSDTVSSSSDVSIVSNVEKDLKRKIDSKSTSKKKVKQKTSIAMNALHVKMSPLRKETQKTFMKIKPKKPQTKERSKKNNKSFCDNSRQLHTKNMSSKRNLSSKEQKLNPTPELVAAPTKSRRKSATPRKLHCTSSFNSNPLELCKNQQDMLINVPNSFIPQNSDTDQPQLRWSDDSSQDVKSKEVQKLSGSQNEDDDIEKIKQYIETTTVINVDVDKGNKKGLNSNLDKGDYIDKENTEAAKTIEQVLLYTPPRLIKEQKHGGLTPCSNDADENIVTIIECKDSDTIVAKDGVNETNDSDQEEDLEFTVTDCNETSENYVSFMFNDNNLIKNPEQTKLKDNFCIEVCIDDEATIRLKATPFCCTVDLCPKVYIEDDPYSNELAAAVSSISNIDKLYTPMKDPRTQCIEIFDSTLTSLDTPLKANSTNEKEFENTANKTALEVENIDIKDKETRKRKRDQSVVTDEPVSSTKKNRNEVKTQYLLTSANIQNMDIESVLSKLHGK